MTTIMQYMDDTLDEEDGCKCRSRDHDFTSKFRCRRAADEFPPALHVTDMQTMNKQTNSYSSSFSFWDLKLANRELNGGHVDDSENVIW